MGKIKEESIINLLKEKFPKFIPYWDDYVNYWGSDLGSLEVIPFAYYTVDEIKSENYLTVEDIFIFIEFLMCNGNQAVQDVVATCYLESLLNRDPEEIQFIKFRQYLGKETIAYCRAWDEFTGVYTKGLHEEIL